MDHIIRYICILEQMPIAPKPSISTKDMLEKLEEKGFSVTLRSLQRDLAALAKYYPIICNNKVRPNRWCFTEDYQGSFAAMDVPSAVSTILVNEYLQSIMPAPLLAQLNPQLNRAKSFLKSQSDKTYASWMDKVRIIPDGKSLVPASIDPDVWELICDAIMSNKALDVAYCSHKKNELKSFTLHPYGLMVRKSATYVIGSYNDYKDVRQYALQRFRSLEFSRESFRPNPNFSVKKYIDSGESGFKYSDEPIHLSALISKDLAKRLAETKLSNSQLILNTPNVEWFILRAVVPDDRDTRVWLRGQGASVVVHEPAFLREEMMSEAEKLLKLSDELLRGGVCIS